MHVFGFQTYHGAVPVTSPVATVAPGVKPAIAPEAHATTTAAPTKAVETAMNRFPFNSNLLGSVISPSSHRRVMLPHGTCATFPLRIARRGSWKGFQESSALA